MSAKGRTAHRAGLAAEAAAARWYEALGGVVEARRWRAEGCRALGAGEIDLIVSLHGVLVFVEVKAGRSAQRRDAISDRQWARLEAGAEAYMMTHQTGDRPVRFDAAFMGADGTLDVVENARSFEAW